MHKKAHKQFAEDSHWNHVLWSDETKINLFGSDGVKRVWQQQGEEYKDKCVLPRVKHVGGSVMIWGWMNAAGTGELQFTEGIMNANMCNMGLCMCWNINIVLRNVSEHFMPWEGSDSWCQEEQ